MSQKEQIRAARKNLEKKRSKELEKLRNNFKVIYKVINGKRTKIKLYPPTPV